jgi:hypothetical protein
LKRNPGNIEHLAEQGERLLAELVPADVQRGQRAVLADGLKNESKK